MPLIEIEKKEKNLSLWNKCKIEIENFTLNYKLQNALFRYLELRLAMKDKQLYGVGQWKGLLKKLSSLSNDTNTRIKIVEQSIERGWGTFVDIKPNYNKNNFGEFSGMSCSQDNDNEDVRGYF